MWFKKKRLETPFKGDDVKALKKRQIVKTWSFISLRKLRKLQYVSLCAMLFWFSVTKQSLENGFGFPKWSEIHKLPLVLKFNVTLARPLRLVILLFFNANSCQMIGTCIFMTANETSRYDVDRLTHTKWKKVNKQCLLDTPHTVRNSEKTWQVIVQTSRPKFWKDFSKICANKNYKLLHAYVQCVCIVSAKYQIAPSKAVVEVDPPIKALSMHIQKP